MIKVIVNKNKSNNYSNIEVSGHAEYSEYGTDVICAAVSILVINTINALEKYTDDIFYICQDEKKGLIKLSFQKSNSFSAKLLLDTLMLGLDGLSDEYGTDYIKISYKEV